MEDINKYYEAAEILKVLGHPTRLCIVNGLIRNKGCNVSFMQSCLNIPQSTVSQHISKLKSAGIIVGERKGLEITYKVVNQIAIDLVTSLFKD
ncbi:MULTISPECIES: ArsR/SmtB family transcription factor [Vallitalea]|uniref:Metalloregulator ArsR/SmtB family transcription factor n=1 Tax=Vallitalea maricola TaxID=3074433 RepID=A0ACB5UQN6_9FIRM|nr:metalloregulator ArsR/SmtB family transcription factor [Vallitalea guaymasensis]GMQ65086.1 metalloregulator ArsR/SmtB family transcription factor [Vallitalea sp. AN17-2]